MPNNYLSVLYKHIIQVENKSVRHKHTIAPPIKKVGGACAPPCPPPPLPTPGIYIYTVNLAYNVPVGTSVFCPLYTKSLLRVYRTLSVIHMGILTVSN